MTCRIYWGEKSTYLMVGNINRRVHWEDIVVDGKVILKWILKFVLQFVDRIAGTDTAESVLL